MNIRIHPGRLHGGFTAPASKSAAHRAILCAALSAGQSRVEIPTLSEDIRATLAAVQVLGARCRFEGDTSVITGGPVPEKADINCGESGSTLRFLLPVAAALGVATTFRGGGKLPSRPISPLKEEMERHGIRFDNDGRMPFTISGRLTPGSYRLPGDVSSQYVTGLLMALPLLEGDSTLEITSPLQSRSYVDMTLETIARFGIRIEQRGNMFHIPGNQAYHAADSPADGDYSGAAFYLCAGALGGPVACRGLYPASLQGDRAIIEILKRAGASVSHNRDIVIVETGRLIPLDVDVGNIPDLAPVLAAVLAFAPGVSTIYNAERLRIKESDRLAATADGLTRMGADVTVLGDRLVICGNPLPEGGTEVGSYGDHRIAMTMAVASCFCRQPVTIQGAECVSKSYPGFFEDFKRLGGRMDVIGI